MTNNLDKKPKAHKLLETLRASMPNYIREILKKYITKQPDWSCPQTVEDYEKITNWFKQQQEKK